MIPLDTKQGTAVWMVYLENLKVIRVEVHHTPHGMWSHEAPSADEPTAVTVVVPTSETLDQLPFKTREIGVFYLTEVAAQVGLADRIGRMAQRQRVALEELGVSQAKVLERVTALLEGAPPGATP